MQRQLDGLSTRFEASHGHRGRTSGRPRSPSSSAASEALTRGPARYARPASPQTFEQRSASLVESVSARLESTVGSVSDSWRGALAQQERVSENLSRDTQQALAAAAATFEQHSASLLRTVDQAHADLQTEIASRDQQRLAAWTQSLEAMAASLQQEWQQAGAHAAGQQQQICETLAQTAREHLGPDRSAGEATRSPRSKVFGSSKKRFMLMPLSAMRKCGSSCALRAGPRPSQGRVPGLHLVLADFEAGQRIGAFLLRAGQPFAVVVGLGLDRLPVLAAAGSFRASRCAPPAAAPARPPAS